MPTAPDLTAIPADACPEVLRLWREYAEAKADAASVKEAAKEAKAAEKKKLAAFDSYMASLGEPGMFDGETD